MGAVAISNKKYGVRDNKKVVEADITFSSSYATGGDTVSVPSLGMNRVDEIGVPSHDLITKKPVAAAGPQAGRSVQLAGTGLAPLLKVYDTAGTEATAATNLSGVTVRVRFVGI